MPRTTTISPGTPQDPPVAQDETPDDPPADAEPDDSDHVKAAMALLRGVDNPSDDDISPDQAAYRKLRESIFA